MRRLSGESSLFPAVKQFSSVWLTRRSLEHGVTFMLEMICRQHHNFSLVFWLSIFTVCCSAWWQYWNYVISNSIFIFYICLSVFLLCFQLATELIIYLFIDELNPLFYYIIFSLWNITKCLITSLLNSKVPTSDPLFCFRWMSIGLPLYFQQIHRRNSPFYIKCWTLPVYLTPWHATLQHVIFLRAKVYTQADGKVCIHPKSVNAEESEFNYTWLIYHLKMRTSSVSRRGGLVNYVCFFCCFFYIWVHVAVSFLFCIWVEREASG